MAGSDPEKLMVKADKMTKLNFTRWTADWRNASGLSEQAAVAFRLAKNYEKAKLAFEKASRAQEMLSSPWDAAKHMESAASMAKELQSWNEVSEFYRSASHYYIECGRSQPASDALAKGARALAESLPEEAISLYTESCAILEDDEKEQMAFDLYREASSIYVKLEKYEDAASILLRWGLAADKCQAKNSQCKAYLSAILVYLYAHDFKQAEKCYNDCCQTDAFMGSDQFRTATKLISAYREGDAEEIKRVGQSNGVSHLDNVIIKLARKLPTSEVDGFRVEASGGAGEELDDDDLT